MNLSTAVILHTYFIKRNSLYNDENAIELMLI